MIIDFHTHIFSRDIIENRNTYLDDPNFQALYGSPKAVMIDHNDLMIAMQQNGIDRSVAMGYPWTNEKYCENQNKYFSKIFMKSGDRIIPFGSIPMKKGINVENWITSIKQQGLFGIGEIAFYHEGLSGVYLQLLEEIITTAAKSNLPVCLHVNEPLGHTYDGKYETSFTHLYSIIRRCPDALLILAHWGGGILFYELMPEIKSGFANVYYDTAASPFLYDNKVYSVALNILGSEKIVFGSDYPLIQPARYLEALRREVRETQEIKNILANNSLRILNLTEE